MTSHKSILLVGLIVAFAGSGLLSGRTWARVVGITLAVVSAIAVGRAAAS